MANSKYAYVRNFELPDPLLPGTFLVFRLDGHSFHRFSDAHEFAKPNDVRALQLMDHAARDTMELYPDIVLAFGDFLLKKSTSIYNRRQSKIVSTLTSQFTSSYVFYWPRYFPNTPLQYPPSFDGRIVLYPTEKVVTDYFAWRQADTHINNLYNTTFWALVQQGGQTPAEAHATLRGTFSKDKNEILFSRFNINYNTIDSRFRKGSILVREEVDDDVLPLDVKIQASGEHVPQHSGSPSRAKSPRSGAIDAPGTSVPAPVLVSSDPSNMTKETIDFVDHDLVPKSLVSHEPYSASVVSSGHQSNDQPISTSNPDNSESNESSIPVPTSEVHNQEPTQTITRSTTTQPTQKGKSKSKAKSKSKSKVTRIVLLHCDIIHEEFWSNRPELLSD
ncbi:hypothetical protein D9756_002965 [Leucocoprinus leucothites]|uniref:tRNA(His) guanylyltransferase n=1 Tax=Leucocoprinus leucothites TaxID=201217 RepID=A0A8H5LJ01_9AGAR|nr:hypothetical protein D9756_002965 [Leucoagaricus leucothites]